MAARSITSSKLIVSNRSALLAKYGATGVKAIEAAVRLMVKADKARSITTVLVYLDDKAAMGSNAVQSASNAKQNKDAVDFAYSKQKQPDYLMILGAPDVVAFQDLTNPVAGQDADPTVPSDLPYACAAPFSKLSSKFVGPTRVVGRLPDQRGGTSAQYLVDLIAAATKATPFAAALAPFAVTASVWTASTQLSLDAIFGNHAALLVSPPQGTTYASGALSAPLHFVNCHGSPADPQFYGQAGPTYPPAMQSQNLGVGAGGVGPACVAAFECCYGAELYPPAVAGGVASIADTYLSAGADAVMGSTTIAYGPAATNDWADVLCATFLSKVRSGSSTGRAMLESRQDYVKSKGTMSPTDLKTLAQFVLLGDPSITPVVTQAGANGHGVLASVAATKSFGGPGSIAVAERTRRRAKLVQFGAALGAVTKTAGVTSRPATPRARAALQRLLDSAGGGSPAPKPAGAKLAGAPRRTGTVEFLTYDVSASSGRKGVFAAAGITAVDSLPAAPDAIHIAIEEIGKVGNATWYKLSEVHEVGGQMVPRAVGYSR